MQKEEVGHIQVGTKDIFCTIDAAHGLTAAIRADFIDQQQAREQDYEPVATLLGDAYRVHPEVAQELKRLRDTQSKLVAENAELKDCNTRQQGIVTTACTQADDAYAKLDTTRTQYDLQLGVTNELQYRVDVAEKAIVILAYAMAEKEMEGK